MNRAELIATLKPLIKKNWRYKFINAPKESRPEWFRIFAARTSEQYLNGPATDPSTHLASEIVGAALESHSLTQFEASLICLDSLGVYAQD